MHLLTAVLLAQLAQPVRQSPPVLEFPEPGLDDTTAYQGYRTRFYRDATRNTVQIYIDGRTARVVHLLADANNESVGFSVRAADGTPVPIRWISQQARTWTTGRTRILEHQLVADAQRVSLGLFVLGSMRVERDFQYAGRHRGALSAGPYRLPEFDRMFAALTSLEPAERTRHLALVGTQSITSLRARLDPTISTRHSGATWVARVVQTSFDGLDTLALEVRVDTTRVAATRAGDSLTLAARTGRSGVPFTVLITSTTKPLTPLSREQIFTPDFLRFLAQSRMGRDRVRARWLERQVRGVELLSSREKLMAGLPAYATYFGRDMLLSALMMRPIWRDEMSEFVIASVLRKLSPTGQVSHEEALGGQAVREAAAEYAQLVSRGELDRAREVLQNHRRVRENYHMVDDEFQLPILAARWLTDPDVSADRKRAFLRDSSDGAGARVTRLVRELALVSRMSAPYAASPAIENLISFPARDTGWSSASWRDSGAGYAGGRFAMDINAIYTPHALESIGQILATIRTLGISLDSLAGAVPELSGDSILGRYARDPALLRAATDAWWGASKHFLVRLGAEEVRSAVAARLGVMPEGERAYWTQLLATTPDQDSLAFLALALDGRGQPIRVVNSDPATGLFLGERPGETALETLRDVRLFVRNYPVGLFINRVGPVVANDAYATPGVWNAFLRDHYHGPRVAWGREVNLFLLGAADRAAKSTDAVFKRELANAITKVREAVAASGFRSELWSYEIREGQLVPIRYATGSDVQLWSTTDLAVQYALSRLAR
jgi:hypothetical protein